MGRKLRWINRIVLYSIKYSSRSQKHMLGIFASSFIKIFQVRNTGRHISYHGIRQRKGSHRFDDDDSAGDDDGIVSSFYLDMDIFPVPVYGFLLLENRRSRLDIGAQDDFRAVADTA